MTWLLGSTETTPELEGRGKTPLPAFNRVVELFSKAADTLLYETLTREIASLGLLPFHSPLVAVLLLLAQSESSKLQCSAKAQEITDAFLDFADSPSASMTFHVDREKLERLLDTAHVVARFYATNLVWEEFGVGAFPHDGGGGEERDSESAGGGGRGGGGGEGAAAAAKKQKMDESRVNISPAHLAMPYTVEEEAWLRDSLDKFSAAYKEVSLGEEFRSEFVMFSYDVPLSKRFVPDQIAAFVERGRGSVQQ